ncbi:hypothetical protein EJ06DRAFT_534716 [Trichodelitschia bisporula]|uniref:Uncharacterized protein n=1 Tax=Trichodelitschia bisporula TaxID=703511 RepID=A0A6G1HIA6_9PEZI|nr:hypothetical protein EJ06DRAFT_534716 [Trichodelitschia bisporula]
MLELQLHRVPSRQTQPSIFPSRPPSLPDPRHAVDLPHPISKPRYPPIYSYHRTHRHNASPGSSQIFLLPSDRIPSPRDGPPSRSAKPSTVGSQAILDEKKNGLSACGPGD